MFASLKSPRKWLLLLIDVAIIVSAYYALALLETLGVDSLKAEGDFTVLKILLAVVCFTICRLIGEVYSMVWRYAIPRTYIQLVAADVVAGLIFIIVGRFINIFYLGIGYSIFFILAVMFATLLSRFFYQVAYALKEKKVDEKDNAEKGALNKINIAIVGAGNIGASLAEGLLRNPQSHYRPVCFTDIDPQKIGNNIYGLKVYADDENIVDTIKAMPVQEIIIALPNASSDERNRLYERYKETGCKVKLYDYPTSDEGLKKGPVIREFNIEDLLFRDTIKVDGTQTANFYKGKTVLVTGGGGSIGSELCRQIARMKPKKLVVLDIYENNAYDLQQELVRAYGNMLDLDVIIASVRDENRLDEIFNEIRPNIVLHAAAHKHVPLMERSGCEAIKNNVFGTYNLANMAEKYGVEKFLLISTDKAVNPTNIMGATKRLCEMVIQCRKDSKTEFCAVRFGNVLGSNGSVIPLFRRQIASGGPVTITDKRIIRYFMTIPEAVSLVLEAGFMAKNGELFVLDMGKPVKILDLAERMIRMEGKVPYVDIDIQEIGLRPGEKLYEELLMENEKQKKTANDRIFIEIDEPYTREQVEEKLAVLKQAAIDDENVRQAIIDTVPTFVNAEEVNMAVGYVQ